MLIYRTSRFPTRAPGDNDPKFAMLTLPTEPPPAMVAPEPTVTIPVGASEPLIANVPFETIVCPLYVLAPVSVRMPDPTFVNPNERVEPSEMIPVNELLVPAVPTVNRESLDALVF